MAKKMAESSDENPVEFNAMGFINVTFCLLIFFICSFKFKQLEGKIETWLPKDRGVNAGTPDKVVLEEIRVFMRWDAPSSTTIRKVASRSPAASDKELMGVILAMVSDYKRAGKTDFPVLIDATGEVPWRDVIHLMDLCKQENLERIEFASPIEMPAKN